MILERLHREYIRGIEKKAIVVDKRVLLCHITYAVRRGISLSSNNAYINTRVLKHLYDKRPAEEYDFIIHNLHKILRYPDCIYKNRQEKRGEYCLVKDIKNKKYLCSIEVGELKEINTATAFRVADNKYLEKYELLWSWKDDAPSS